MIKVVPFISCSYIELYANTYVLIDESDNCIIVDPGKDNNEVIDFIKESELKPRAILLTHGHFDHIRGVKRLIDEYSVPLYVGFDEVDMLTNPRLNCSKYMSEEYVLDVKPVTLSDNEILRIMDEDILCISTPFHTFGSMCFYLKDSKLLFTGDFLFKGSVGRSDLPTGTPKTFNDSIRKILSLPDDVKIYPGHGPSSNIKLEKEINPFIKSL